MSDIRDTVCAWVIRVLPIVMGVTAGVLVSEGELYRPLMLFALAFMFIERRMLRHLESDA